MVDCFTFIYVFRKLIDTALKKNTNPIYSNLQYQQQKVRKKEQQHFPHFKQYQSVLRLYNSMQIFPQISFRLNDKINENTKPKKCFPHEYVLKVRTTDSSMRRRPVIFPFFSSLFLSRCSHILTKKTFVWRTRVQTPA